MQDLISKAATLFSALPYIQKFSGETFVVKYGGLLHGFPDPAMRNGVARDIVFRSGRDQSVVVHGGGKAITPRDGESRAGGELHQGQRVTDEATVQIVDDVVPRDQS